MTTRRLFHVVLAVLLLAGLMGPVSAAPALADQDPRDADQPDGGGPPADWLGAVGPTVEWINGPVAGAEWPPFADATLHPSSDGHKAIADAIGGYLSSVHAGPTGRAGLPLNPAAVG